MEGAAVAPPPSKRKNVVERTIVYGNSSMYLPLDKREDSQKSHVWTCYVRGAQDEDISYFVKAVTFHFHDTCVPNVIRRESPPFEETQQVHALVLWDKAKKSMSSKEEVIAQTKRVVRFKSPSPDFARRLREGHLRAKRAARADPELANLRFVTELVDKEYAALLTKFERRKQQIDVLRHEIAVISGEPLPPPVSKRARPSSSTTSTSPSAAAAVGVPASAGGEDAVFDMAATLPAPSPHPSAHPRPHVSPHAPRETEREHAAGTAVEVTQKEPSASAYPDSSALDAQADPLARSAAVSATPSPVPIPSSDFDQVPLSSADAHGLGR